MNVSPGDMFVAVRGINRGTIGTSLRIASHEEVIAALQAQGALGHVRLYQGAVFHEVSTDMRWKGSGVFSQECWVPFATDANLRRLPPPEELGLLDEVWKEEGVGQ